MPSAWALYWNLYRYNCYHKHKQLSYLTVLRKAILSYTCTHQFNQSSTPTWLILRVNNQKKQRLQNSVKSIWKGIGSQINDDEKQNSTLYQNELTMIISVNYCNISLPTLNRSWTWYIKDNAPYSAVSAKDIRSWHLSRNTITSQTLQICTSNLILIDSVGTLCMLLLLKIRSLHMQQLHRHSRTASHTVYLILIDTGCFSPEIPPIGQMYW